MTNPFTNAIAGALSTLQSVAGGHVRYRRGDATIDLPRAVRGVSRYESEDGRGLVTDYAMEDFLFASAALILAGVRVEPEAGDQIEQTVGDQVLVYELMSPGGQEPAWRYSDTGRTQLRVHTKLVAQEAAS